MKLTDNATGIQHLGIPTEDLEKTVAFYEKLGFDLTWGNGEVAFLKLGDLVVEAYGFKGAAMKSGAIDHVALNVKDVKAAYELAKENGLEIIPAASPTGVDTLPFFDNGVSFFTIIGPNREKIEFNQVL